MSETNPPEGSGEYLEFARQAVLCGQLLARLTDNFLSADDGDRAVENGKELYARLGETTPVLRHVLPWWTATQLPSDPPAAASYLEWTYRRARAALAHAFAGAEALWGDWTVLAKAWGPARAFMCEHIPPVDVDLLDARLRAEALAAKPAQVPVSIFDGGRVIAEIEAWEHRCAMAGTAKEHSAAIPYTSPLSAPDLARLLREQGYSAATNDAVDAWLRRHRETCPDSYEERNRDDRRRNEPKYLYRADVWPALVQHFACATDGN
jgi:hypothetical protein